MRVTPMHRIRVGSLRTSPSTNFASSKPRYLLRVLQAVLIFVTSALLSQASLVPSTLVSATTPTWHSVSLPLGQGLYGTNNNFSKAIIETITCSSGTTCLAGGSSADGAVLLSSTNGGATWHPVSLPRGQGLYGHNGSGGGLIYTITCSSGTTCLAGGFGAKGAVLLSAPNPVSSTLTSKLPVIGEVVVLLVILVIIALALQRRRAKRAPALAGVGTANNSAPPTQSAPPTPGSDSSLTHNDSGAGWLNCRSCGGQNPRDNRFCSHCGKALDGDPAR
jgi:hypothetical protein